MDEQGVLLCIKVGFSVNPARRLRKVCKAFAKHVGRGVTYYQLHQVEASDAREMETVVKRACKSVSLFQSSVFDGSTECFASSSYSSVVSYSKTKNIMSLINTDSSSLRRDINYINSLIN